MTDLLRLIDHPLVATLGWTLTHFVWQGALLGLAAFFLLRVVRPTYASTRYAIGAATLALMLLVPVATFLTTAGQTASAQRRSTPPTDVKQAGLVTGAMVANLAENPTAVRQLMPSPRAGASSNEAPIAPVWLPVVTAIWMIGVGLLSLRMAGGWVVTQMLACRAVSRVSEQVEAAAHEMARRLNVNSRFLVRESAAVTAPTLVGWLKPVILLPASVLTGLSPTQLQAVVAHELAHIRRHDYLVNLLQTFVETLLFYHPAVWWVSSEVRAEREHCCDDLAVDACGDRLVYVSALAELTSIERRAFALAATDGSLVTRVRRILGRPGDPRRELPPSWGVLVLLVAVGGGAGTYELTADASDVAQIAGAAAATSATPTARFTELPPRVVPSESLRTAVVTGAAALPQAVVPNAPSVPTTPGLPSTPDTPSAPAAPAHPPAPAPPTAASQPTGPGQRSEGNFVWNNDRERLTVRWTGAYRLSDDERDIGWVEEGARVTIADGWVFTDRVELRGLPGGQVERKFYRSGVERDFDASAQAFLTSAVQRMIHHGMFAAERVARLLKQGGVDAVLAEIERLQTASGHVKRTYYSALLKQASLSNAQLSRVVDRVAEFTSDHEKATVLVQVLQAPPVTDDHRLLAVRAAAKIDSDFEQRKVLTAALAGTSLADRSALVLGALEVLQTSVQSAFERATVLADIAKKGGVTTETSSRFMNAVSTMPSSHEQRKVLAAVAARPALAESVLLEGVKTSGTISSAHDRRQTVVAYIDRPDVTPKVASAALASAATISSGHDKAELLIHVIAKGGVSDDTASAFFAAAESIASGYDKRRVLMALTERPLSDAMVAHALRTTKTISSSHDRATVLLQMLKTQTLSAANRTAFVDAATTITAPHEQNQVLAALVRSESAQKF